MKKKVVSLMLVLSMAAAMFAGCGSSGKDSSKDEAKKDDSKGSVYYLNFKPEVDKQWQKIAKAYTEKTGVEVKVVTAASNQYETTLKSEIAEAMLLPYSRSTDRLVMNPGKTIVWI